MSSFPNYFSGLSGLFGWGGGPSYGQGMQSSYASTGSWNPVENTPEFGFSSSRGQHGLGGSRFRPTRFSAEGDGRRSGPTYGQLMQFGLGQDYLAAEGARQQELGMFQNVMGNLQGLMGSPQFDMAGMAAAGAAQARGDIDSAAGAMRGIYQAGQADYDRAMKEIGKSFGTAQKYFTGAISTMKDAIRDHDFFRKDTVAANVLGLQQQFKNQLDAIQMDSSITDEQRSMMQDDLRRSMQNSTASLASQADQAAAESLLGAKNALSQLQAAAGTTLGNLQLQAGSAMGSLATARTGMGVEMESNIGNLYNSMNQFSMSMLQSAMASSFQNQLQGNMAMASIIQQMPLGPVSLAEMLARMAQAGGGRVGDVADPYLMNLLGIT